MAKRKLVVSRQRRWQLERIAKGLCVLCGKHAVTAVHCEKHRQLDLARKQRKRDLLLDAGRARS